MNRLYALSDDTLTPPDTLLASTQEILSCGVSIFQYRCKEQKDESLARELLYLCKRFGAKFVINDDLEFAVKIGANALHIGKDDATLAQARSELGKDAFIGVSCYNDLNLAINAEQNGASYVAFGAMFASPTKPNATSCDINILNQAKQILKIPVCAIGGINVANICQIAKTGVDYIAVVNALYKPHSIKQNIANLNKAIENIKK